MLHRMDPACIPPAFVVSYLNTRYTFCGRFAAATKEAGMKRFCEFLAFAALCCSVAAAVVLLLRCAKRRRPAPYLTLYNHD